MTFLSMIFGNNKVKVFSSISLEEAKADLFILGERIAEFSRVIEESELQKLQKAHVALREIVEKASENMVILTPENLVVINNVKDVLESEIGNKAPYIDVSKYFEGVPSFYSNTWNGPYNNEEQQSEFSQVSKAYEYTQILYEMQSEVTSNIEKIKESINAANNTQELFVRQLEQEAILANILTIQNRIADFINYQNGSASFSSQYIPEDPTVLINEVDNYIRNYYREEEAYPDLSFDCSMVGWALCFGVSIELNRMNPSSVLGGDFHKDNFI